MRHNLWKINFERESFGLWLRLSFTVKLVPVLTGLDSTKQFVLFLKPQSHPSGFHWGHQCSWTLTPANIMQISIMQSDDGNRK